MKELLERMSDYNYEQVVFNYEQVAGLKVIIAIHDTTLGPALGGTRFWDYETEEEALIDVLRLAKGMTYKNAAAGLNLGGGKAVIIGKPGKLNSEELWRAYGRFVQSLNGRYITAEDVNTCVEDMSYVAEETDYVGGLKETSGDPSPITAYGVLQGMKAAVEEIYGTPDLKNKIISIQGVGHVGYYLAKYVSEEGGKLVIADIKQKNIERVIKDFGAEVVEPNKIYEVDCDVFAPCALGAVINDETVPRLNCNIIAGSANNVLAEEYHGDLLEEQGIFYAPDYIINAGGVINIDQEIKGYNRDRALNRVKNIYKTVKKVIKISKRDSISTYKAADILAEERIEAVAGVRKNYIPV